MSMSALFEMLGMKVSEFFAGLFGGMASFFILPKEERLNPLSALTYMIVGAFCAGYFTEFSLDYFEWSHSFSGAMAFMIGALGIYIVKTIVRVGSVGLNNPFTFLQSLKNGPSQGKNEKPK